MSLTVRPDHTALFPALAAQSAFDHRFTLRCPGVPSAGERNEVLARLRPRHLAIIQDMGFAEAAFREAEQVHGARVAVVTAASPGISPDADGLIAQDPGVVLGIYVADCCAVYLIDPQRLAWGLVHAGRKGAELGIVPHAIGLMGEHFGCEPRDIIVQISPSIRPPHYEMNPAALVLEQCLAAGITPEHLHDCGENTATDLSRYYSYRMEKGSTGRMLALLARRASV